MNSLYLERLLNYAKKYEDQRQLNELKTIHMLSVSQIIYKLAMELQLNSRMTNLAYITGLYHDLGRFEQIKIYKTFRDDQSVDHAELSADIMLSGDFIKELPVKDQCMIEKAVRNHNKLTIEDGLDDETLLLTKMIRDSDKADIYRVIKKNGIKDSYNFTETELENSDISHNISKAVFEHRTANIADRVYPLDFPVTGMAMIFDVNFRETLRLIYRNGYYLCGLDTISVRKNEANKMLQLILKEVNCYIEQKITE